MKDKLNAWTVETTDLTARVAAAIGAPSAGREILDELRAVRREIAELRATTALLQDEVARLRRDAPAVRRIAPFGSAEGRARLS